MTRIHCFLLSLILLLQVQKTSKVYRRLSEMLGLNDESMVLSVIIRKVITNLKFWGACELIISKTLQLLSDLSVGYGTVRKLVKLEEVSCDWSILIILISDWLIVSGWFSLVQSHCRTLSIPGCQCWSN